MVQDTERFDQAECSIPAPSQTSTSWSWIHFPRFSLEYGLVCSDKSCLGHMDPPASRNHNMGLNGQTELNLCKQGSRYRYINTGIWTCT